jgi:AraC-like DNA-binding protein
MKLAAIGSAVGYESESSFGKVFRRVMGISPGQYRKREEAAGLDTGATCDPGALFKVTGAEWAVDGGALRQI